MDEQKKSTRFLNIVIAFLIIIGVIILIVVKVNVPEFKLGYLLLSILILVLVLVGIWFIIRYLYNRVELKQDSSGKLPTAIDMVEARTLAEKLIKEHHSDYLDITNQESENLGKSVKSIIANIEGVGRYSNNKYNIIMNCHFPAKTVSILVNKQRGEILRAKIMSASYPDDEPNLRVIKSRNVLTGAEQVVEEINKPEDIKIEKKKEDEL